MESSVRRAMSGTMQGLRLVGKGGPENLVVSDIALPPLPLDQIRVKVGFAAMCYRDVLDRKGAFPFIKNFLPLTSGHEFSGVVVDCGRDASAGGVVRGDRVVGLHWAPCLVCPRCLEGASSVCEQRMDSFLGLTRDGCFAQFISLRPSGVVKLPSNRMTSAQASTLACTFGTVYHAAFVRGRLRKGETVLLTGASGGVGCSAVQLLRAFGCRVIALTTSPKKESFLKELGADIVTVLGENGKLNPPCEVSLSFPFFYFMCSHSFFS